MISHQTKTSFTHWNARIEGVDFGRRDINIANEIYDYSKGAAMGRFKHPRKGVKMDRTTEDITAPVPPAIMKYYKDIHLNIDILFVNKTAFLLAISRDIGIIHCRSMASSVTKKTECNETNYSRLSSKGIQDCNCFWGRCIQTPDQLDEECNF